MMSRTSLLVATSDNQPIVQKVLVFSYLITMTNNSMLWISNGLKSLRYSLILYMIGFDSHSCLSIVIYGNKNKPLRGVAR